MKVIQQYSTWQWNQQKSVLFKTIVCPMLSGEIALPFPAPQGAGSAEAEDIGQAVGGNGHGTAGSTEGIPGEFVLDKLLDCGAVQEMW